MSKPNPSEVAYRALKKHIRDDAKIARLMIKKFKRSKETQLQYGWECRLCALKDLMFYL